VADRVKFINNVANRELPSYYRAANVFCLLSHLEGMPKVVLESLASGVPVIASKSFHTTQLIENMIVRVEVSQAVELAEKIHTVTEARTIPDSELIRREYDWRCIVQRIQTLYKTL
jgi:glycosyltransferase involved in cell wall biosynthesis